MRAEPQYLATDPADGIELEVVREDPDAIAASIRRRAEAKFRGRIAELEATVERLTAELAKRPPAPAHLDTLTADEAEQMMAVEMTHDEYTKWRAENQRRSLKNWIATDPTWR